jgi:hypothetical protein
MDFFHGATPTKCFGNNFPQGEAFERPDHALGFGRVSKPTCGRRAHGVLAPLLRLLAVEHCAWGQAIKSLSAVARCGVMNLRSVHQES